MLINTRKKRSRHRAEAGLSPRPANTSSCGRASRCKRERRLCRADQCRAARWPSRRAPQHPQERQCIDARCGEGGARSAPAGSVHRFSRAPAYRACRSVCLRARRDCRSDSRGRHCDRTHRADDPAVFGKLALHSHHRGVHSAVDSHLNHRAQPDGRDHQHNDPRRPRARRRHPGRRRHSHHREHRALSGRGAAAAPRYSPGRGTDLGSRARCPSPIRSHRLRMPSIRIRRESAQPRHGWA